MCFKLLTKWGYGEKLWSAPVTAHATQMHRLLLDYEREKKKGIAFELKKYQHHKLIFFYLQIS